jgi:hypothetical protein
MSRIFIPTRGIDSWRQRLARPDRHWRRRYSAFETAVSWEAASSMKDGLPAPIRGLFAGTNYGAVNLIQAIAEHKVPLPGGRACSQCDVWATVSTSLGILSMSVEAKAKESFGNETLAGFLVAGKSEDSKQNRGLRWDFIRSHLPQISNSDDLRYQILHRCAAAVIEALRLNLKHAAFVVQAFTAPEESFQQFASFCRAVGIEAVRGRLAATSVGGISLGIGWGDCPFATDREVAATISAHPTKT